MCRWMRVYRMSPPGKTRFKLGRQVFLWTSTTHDDFGCTGSKKERSELKNIILTYSSEININDYFMHVPLSLYQITIVLMKIAYVEELHQYLKDYISLSISLSNFNENICS